MLESTIQQQGCLALATKNTLLWWHWLPKSRAGRFDGELLSLSCSVLRVRARPRSYRRSALRTHIRKFRSILLKTEPYSKKTFPNLWQTVCWLINMEKWIGLLCANVFLLKTTLANTVVFNFALAFSHGANNFSHNVPLSINKSVKKILSHKRPLQQPFLRDQKRRYKIKLQSAHVR